MKLILHDCNGEEILVETKGIRYSQYDAGFPYTKTMIKFPSGPAIFVKESVEEIFKMILRSKNKNNKNEVD